MEQSRLQRKAVCYWLQKRNERERERGGLRNKRSRVIREEKTNDIFCGTFGECIRYY
jgi:hypothetical protein